MLGFEIDDFERLSDGETRAPGNYWQTRFHLIATAEVPPNAARPSIKFCG